MIQRLPCQMALALVVGIIAAKSHLLATEEKEALPLFFLILVWHLALFLWCRHKDTWRKALLLAFFLELAALAGFVRYRDVSRQLQGFAQGLSNKQQVTIQGIVVQKQKKTDRWTVLLKDCYLKTSKGIHPGGKVLLSLQNTQKSENYPNSQESFREPPLGVVVVAQGTVRLFQESRNDGNFNEKEYYQNQGITCRIFGDSIRKVLGRPYVLREKLFLLQQMLGETYQSYMPEREAGVLSAMLVGEKSMLSEEIKLLYQRSGISHILAISGLHISILGAALYRLLRNRGCSYWQASACACTMLAGFGCMVGMGLSTRRAIFMFVLYLGAQCFGRGYDRENAIAISAIILLLENPCVLFLSGFQLSFGAVLGVLVGQRLCSCMRPRLKLTESVLVSTGIQLVTLPVLLRNYYELPVYSMLLNLFVLPFLAAVLIGGLFGGGFGICALICIAWAFPASGILAYIFDLLAHLLLMFVTFFLQYFQMISSFFLKLPGAVYMSGCPSRMQIFLYYLMLILLCYALHIFDMHKQRKEIVLTVFMLLCCLFFRLPKQSMIAILDVGQGDGIYIHTPDGLDIFVDGGSTDVKGVGNYRILPFLKYHGVAKIDYWFLSHLDKDHVSGMEELAESGYPIGAVVLAREIVKDDAYGHLVQLLRQKSISIQYMQAGEASSAGSSRFTCLLPDASIMEDRNARSLVLFYETEGMKAVFSGDISSEQEKLLLTDRRIQGLTLWKAAHHGSKYSNCKELLEWMSPRYSAVSCAKENDYGHPGAEAVEHMEENSGHVFYTMDSGCLKLTGHGMEEYVKENGGIP